MSSRGGEARESGEYERRKGALNQGSILLLILGMATEVILALIRRLERHARVAANLSTT